MVTSAFMLLHATLRMELWFAMMSHATRTSWLHLDAGIKSCDYLCFLRFLCTSRWSAEQVTGLPVLVCDHCQDASLRLVHIGGVLSLAGIITLQGRSTCEV